MRIILGSAVLVAAASTFLLACGSDATTVVAPQPDAGDPDAGVQADAQVDASPPAPFPAFAIDAPQVANAGGARLATPKLIPIYFSNDDTTFTAKVTDFLGKIGASAYWPPPTKEYGVGTPTAAPPVQLVETAPATLTDAQIQTWLAGKLNADDPAFPAADANSLYILYYPSTTSVSDGQGTSCKDFGGYHGSIALDSAHGTKPVAYAVIPRCATFANLTGINVVTGTSSHEIIEAATDPYPQSDPAYSSVDPDHIAWMFFLGGGELGDMCAQFPGVFYKPSDLSYDVQRSWSNLSAKQGHDPCLPAMPGPYFNTMPVLTDKITLGGGQIITKGVTIPVGQSKTVALQLFSDVDTGGDWTVTAIDSATLRQQPAELELTTDKPGGHNGDVLNLTVKVLKAGQYGAEGFLLESDLGGRKTLWVGLVGN